MALTGVQRQAIKQRSSSDFKLTVDVEAQDPINMMERVWHTLSGPRLEVWMRTVAHPYLERQIVNRFAYQGDRQVGHWPDLSPATVAIREHDGFEGEWPVNIRTEEMFDVLTHEADFTHTPWSAEMVLPGSGGSKIKEKLETAQEGRPPPNPMSDNFGATPPRPVLSVDEVDLATLLDAMQFWVMRGVVSSFRA